jgi:hypothetical protein
LEIDESKAFRTFIRIYFLLKSDRNIKLTLHKVQIISVMTYAYLVWELMPDTYLLN